ncbi:MAG: hypothetical protein WDN06_13590 [Asticcacaulis sp.]
MAHILLIDDHPLFCGGFSATCTSLRPNFRVACAASAAEAIAAMGRMPGPSA